MKAPTLAQMRPVYGRLWTGMVIDADRVPAIDRVAKRILAHKAIYQLIEAHTGVPWALVGCWHYRESNLDLTTYLGNGDPLDHPTEHVPANRGPFFTHPGEMLSAFVRGAIDAIELMGYQKVRFDSLEACAYYTEAWNGWGYFYHDQNSGYLWGLTKQHVKGRYIRDRVYDPEAPDRQIGVMPLLARLRALDPTVTLTHSPGGAAQHASPAGGAVAAGAGAAAAAHQAGYDLRTVIVVGIAAAIVTAAVLILPKMRP